MVDTHSISHGASRHALCLDILCQMLNLCGGEVVFKFHIALKVTANKNNQCHSVTTSFTGKIPNYGNTITLKITILFVLEILHFKYVLKHTNQYRISFSAYKPSPPLPYKPISLPFPRIFSAYKPLPPQQISPPFP